MDTDLPKSRVSDEDANPERRIEMVNGGCMPVEMLLNALALIVLPVLLLL